MKNKDFLINVLCSAIEYRSAESPNHIKRVKEFTRILTELICEFYPERGIKPKDVELIADASCLHDLGKIQIPEQILTKAGKLTFDEFEEMKKHTIYGCDLLETISDNDDIFFKYCYEICRYHHERVDGKGYPEGLRNNQIPIWAQIVSLADVFDALISPRVYRLPIDPLEAYEMIMNGECGAYSKEMLHVFSLAKEKFVEIADYGI